MSEIKVIVFKTESIEEFANKLSESTDENGKIDAEKVRELLKNLIMKDSEFSNKFIDTYNKLKESFLELKDKINKLCTEFLEMKWEGEE